MKLLFTSICLLFSILPSWGQQAIEGTYSSKDVQGTTIRFTKNNKYYYKTVYCIGNTQDSGFYSLSGDTISFQSNLNPADIQSNFFISNTKEHENNKHIDTFYFSIQHLAVQGTKYSVDIFLKDSLLIHIDSLQFYDRKYYSFYLDCNSDSGELKISVNGVTTAVPLDMEVDIQLLENSNSLLAHKDRMILERNKMYSLNLYKSLGKKYYLYKQ